MNTKGTNVKLEGIDEKANTTEWSSSYSSESEAEVKGILFMNLKKS